jgi:hypothetical protein
MKEKQDAVAFLALRPISITNMHRLGGVNGKVS